MSVNGTLIEAKMCAFTLESRDFFFNKCPFYTHDGAIAKFSTNSRETDYSAWLFIDEMHCGSHTQILINCLFSRTAKKTFFSSKNLLFINNISKIKRTIGGLF